MTPNKLALAKAIHEAKIALCWGPKFVGLREPWPNFDDPVVLRAYPHNPIAYVDIALAQVEALERLMYERFRISISAWHEKESKDG